MPTPNLALTPLAAAQSQKHITVNEAFARLDAAVQLSVKDRIRTAPPSNPQDGDRHLIAAPAAGAWQSRETTIAAWDAATLGWQFLTPRAGWRVWVEAESLMLIHDGTAWTSLASSQLGINTSADETNRLAVASDAVLLTHDGAGMQAKLNKATAPDTAAVLFQTDFTGHAEIGLAGDNDLHIKTSPDGQTFTEAMVIDATTARPSFPAGARAGGLVLDRTLSTNCLSDAGRFAGAGVSASLGESGFKAPDYIRPFNGAAFEGYAQFVHNNASYGGGNPALDPEIASLATLMRAGADPRYGPEWWAMKATAGSGTGVSNILDGTTRYAAFFGRTSPMPPAYTVGFFLRILTGSAEVDRTSTDRTARWGADVSADPLAGIVTPSDGWVFIERQMTPNKFGYNNTAFLIYLEGQGDEALIALPRVVIGHVELDPYLPGPLPNQAFMG